MTNLRSVRPNSAVGSRWLMTLTACLIVYTLASASGQTSAPTNVPNSSPPTTISPVPQASNTPSGTLAALPTGADVAVIKIRGLIYGFTLHSLQQSVEHARQNGASLIVLELDTPGGVVTSALKISKYIKSMQVPTVAWVNPEAYSAGIMIAAACNRMVMAPASAAGDCAPIVPGANLSPTERAKALSPILEEFPRFGACQRLRLCVIPRDVCARR